METQLYRKKIIDKKKSPENLDEYIRVADTGVWFILICVIALLIGTLVWGVFGHVESTVHVPVYVENGIAVCYADEGSIKDIAEGMIVRFEDSESFIETIYEKDEDGILCTLSGIYMLPDGVYEGKIVVKDYKPLSFIFN